MNLITLVCRVTLSAHCCDTVVKKHKSKQCVQMFGSVIQTLHALLIYRGWKRLVTLCTPLYPVCEIEGSTPQRPQTSMEWFEGPIIQITAESLGRAGTVQLTACSLNALITIIDLGLTHIFILLWINTLSIPAVQLPQVSYHQAFCLEAECISKLLNG